MFVKGRPRQLRWHGGGPGTSPQHSVSVRPGAPRAGRPQLEVFVDGAKIREAGGSALEARRQTPGVHELRLRHAGNERTYCLTLRECDLVILRAHGATLAAHESVTQGSCRPTP